MNRAAQRRTAPAGRRARLGRRSCRCGKPPRPDAKDHRRTGLSCTSPPRQRLRHGAAVSLRDDADRRTLPPQPVHCHDVVTAPHYPAQLLLGAQSLCTDETHSQDQHVVRPPARRGYRTRVRDHHRARGPDTLDASDSPSQGGPGAPWCAVTSVTGSQPRVRAGLVVVAGEGVTAQGSQRHNRLGRGPGTTTALAGTAVTSRIRHIRHFRHPLPGRGRRIRGRTGSSVRSQHHVRRAVGAASAVVAVPNTCSTPAGGWWWPATGVVRAGYSGPSLRVRVRFSRAVRVGAFGSWVAWVVDGSGRGACSVGSGGPCPHAHEESVGAVVRRPRARHASDASVPGVPGPRAHGWLAHGLVASVPSRSSCPPCAGGLRVPAAPPGRWAGSPCSWPRAPTGGVLNTCSGPLPRRSRAGLA